MGANTKAITGLVATLSAILLIALFAGLIVEANAGITTTSGWLQGQILQDYGQADSCLCTIDYGSAQQLVAPKAIGYKPESKAVSGSQPHVKYNTITDRADTMDRHPVLMDNPGAHNPSYSELMAFLKNDDTVKNKYDYPRYTCANFAVELQHKAESRGINCGYAGINFRGKDTGHAINVFPTTDGGLVYVDLTCGKRIISKNLKAGMKYYNMGIIESVKLYW